MGVLTVGLGYRSLCIERSAVLNVSRSAKEDRQVDLEALAKQFDRLLKKVIQDLKVSRLNKSLR